MKIIEVTPNEFDDIIPNPYFVFGSASFSKLNFKKAEEIFYFLFNDGKFRLGLIGGIRNNIFYSPFSAPFGGFTYLKKEVKVWQIDLAVNHLVSWAKTRELDSIQLTLPPAFYNENFISKQVNSLFNKGFIIEKVDLNYSFYTQNLNNFYLNNIWPNSRNKLKNALKNHLQFRLCKDLMEKQTAFDIIKKNHEAKGYPLRLTWEDLCKTIEIIPHDFFLCDDRNGSSIASAILFKTSEDVVQVIYWGNIPEFSGLRGMNFLAYKIFEYYSIKGIKTVDLGPSTENSIPNHGLCEFKESLGCDISQKLMLIKDLKNPIH